MTESLDLARVVALIADALEHWMRGVDTGAAASLVLERRRPTRAELEAARVENQDHDVAATSSFLETLGVPPLKVPKEVLQRRVAVEGTLVEAIRQLGTAG